MKRLARTLATALVSNSLLAAEQENICSLADAKLPPIELKVPRYKVTTDSALKSTYHSYSYKHAFKVPDSGRGISHLKWESQSVSSEVSAQIDATHEPISLKLSYYSQFSESRGLMHDLDYIDSALAAKTTSSGDLSPAEGFTVNLSSLTFQDDLSKRKLFTELTFDIRRSTKYVTEDVSGFSAIVHTEAGPVIANRIYEYDDDTRDNPPLKFEYREQKIALGQRLEQQYTDFDLNLGASLGYIHRNSTDWHRLRENGRITDLDTHGLTISIGSSVEVPIGKLLLEFFLNTGASWSYGNLHQDGRDGKLKANSKVLEDSTEFSGGLILKAR